MLERSRASEELRGRSIHLPCPPLTLRLPLNLVSTLTFLHGLAILAIALLGCRATRDLDSMLSWSCGLRCYIEGCENMMCFNAFAVSLFRVQRGSEAKDGFTMAQESPKRGP